MPYASRAQAAFLHLHHPEIAAEWRKKGENYVVRHGKDRHTLKHVAKSMKDDYLISKAVRGFTKAGPPPPTWLANDPQPPRATWTNTPRSTKELLRTPKPRYVPERKLQMIRKPGSLRWVTS